jgi:hypothetical protein
VRSLALLLVLTACAGDVCARSEKAASDFPTKVAACQQLPSPRFDLAACTASVQSCTDADLTVIDGYFDCLERLPTCTVADEFTAAVLTCANRMTTVSPGCFSQ